MRKRLGEQERREQILTAAIDVVAERGFEGASATAIAVRAGVSKGLIWHYFADKTELMRQAVLHAVRSLRDEIAASAGPDEPVADAIRGYVRTVARLRRSRPETFRAMERISRRLENADGTSVFSALDYDELYRGQAALFSRGQAAGELRGVDPQVMAVTYQGAVDAMLAYLDAHPDTDADAYAAAVADVLLGGMARQG